MIGSGGGSKSIRFVADPSTVGAANNYLSYSKTIAEKDETYSAIMTNSIGQGTVAGQIFFGGASGQLSGVLVTDSSFEGDLRPLDQNIDPITWLADLKDLPSGCAGGFVSGVIGSKILRSKAKANITMHGEVGGFTDTVINSFISDSSAEGKISKKSYAGPWNSSCNNSNRSSFAVNMRPSGFEGSPAYAYNTVPGGSVLKNNTTSVTRDNSVEVGGWAEGLLNLSLSKYGGDDSQWKPKF